MAGTIAAVVEVAARALVDVPAEVQVTETVHRGVTVVELSVAAGDVGKVIGRTGARPTRCARWSRQRPITTASRRRSRSATPTCGDPCGGTTWCASG
jgi:hypothetical protein